MLNFNFVLDCLFYFTHLMVAFHQKKFCYSVPPEYFEDSNLEGFLTLFILACPHGPVKQKFQF